MTDDDREAFSKVWTAMEKYYARSPERYLPDATMLKISFEALKAYSLAEIMHGLTAHIQNADTGQWRPRPADVIRHITGNSESRANEAWFKVERAIRSVGHYRTVVFDDPWIHAAIVRLGGWVKTAQVTDQELPFLRRSFLSIYRGFTVQPPEGHPAKLLGACEHQNQGLTFERGKDTERPAVIGNVDRARLVYRQGGNAGAAITHHSFDALLEDVTHRLGADDHDEADTGLRLREL